jgi:RimJ/RimL family protein N-acetyltransferase
MIWIGDIQHGGLIARAAGTGFDRDMDVCISRVIGGEFLGGFILTNCNGAICFVHMAGKDARWCSPELMWFMFEYAFRQLKVRRMFCTVCSTNKRSLDMIRRAGWRSEHRIVDGTPTGDLLVFSMAADHCPWLKLRSRYFKTNGGGLKEILHAGA